LDCYDPNERPDKAEEASTATSFHFLGCDISTDSIRPSRDARKRLIERIQSLLAETLSASGNPESAIRERKSYIDLLHTVSNVIRGWGNTYSFCTDDRLMGDLDRQIDRMLAQFQGQYSRIVTRQTPQDKRRLHGVFLLADCNKDEEMRSLVRALRPKGR
jgi:RNA-directed DNA polymerase